MNTSKARKRLEASRRLRQVVAEFYLEGLKAKSERKPVGWIPPMNGAIEIFYAMDIQPVFPENWSPVCAAFGLSAHNFEVAEKMGYSPDLCGYLRNIVGYVHDMMHRPDQPLGGLPRPDIIISCGGGCVPVMKIFQILEERLGPAVFYSDLPQVAPEDIKSHHLDYALYMMEKLISFLEEVTGRRLDMERLREAVRLSDQACALWDELMSYRSRVPSPFSAAEIGLMFVMVTRQGTRTAVDFLADTLAEVKDRADQGAGVIQNEELRIFWDNIPLWYNLGLFNYFEEKNAVVVAETYSSAWSIRLDPARPLESLAYKSLLSYPLVSCVSVEQRIKTVLKACREYKIDGAVLHSNKSCKPITLGQMDIRRALSEELNIPCLILDGDHMDPRNFSEAQAKNRIDAFLEMLKEGRGKK